MLTGGCFCGELRYEVSGTPFHETNCHCTICRRTTGAAFVTWFSVRRAELRFTRGEPRRFQSTTNGTRGFCARCGTQLTFELEGLDEIDITTCSLDAPDALPPKDHTYMKSKLGWVNPADGLPQYRESRQKG
jgi:hypothetical protein